MRNRILYLDFIRIFACVMIIAMHAPIPYSGLSSYMLSADSLLTTPGVGLFIMVSGALILPVNMPTSLFLKKRLARILFPTLFWTLFYMIVALYNLNDADKIILFEYLLYIPLRPQFNGTFWFIYTLAGLYLLAPILSAWLKQTNKQEIKFYLFLWGVTLCYPLTRFFVDFVEDYTGMLYYFCGYVGFFLLGYYLYNYIEKMNVYVCLLLIVFPFVIALGLKITNVAFEFYDLFWFLSIFVAMMTTGWFMLLKKMDKPYSLSSKLHRYVVIVSNCCFGIYLVHIFIMRSIIWKWTWLYDMGIMQIMLVTLMTFIGSFVVTWLISFLPGAQYIIGFKQKR